MGALRSGSKLQRVRTGAEPPAREDAVLRALRREPEFFAARARLKEWVRERFALPADAAVEVRESESTLAGFPPRETVAEFQDGAQRHHFKVFKPLVEVREPDLPPAWMKDALAIPQGYDCDCC